MNNYLLEECELPDGFNYPDAIIKVVNLKLVNIEPWYIMEQKEVSNRLKGMNERYPRLKIIPFARRRDNDDVACFLTNYRNKVQIIHDFASPGYEERKTFDSFWEWFKSAIDDMIYFD